MRIALVLALVCLSGPVWAQDSVVGRYAIVINPTVRADTFLLDTATGRVWQQLQVGPQKLTAWVQQPVLSGGQADALAKAQNQSDTKNH